jgi:probable phosphoglycerate mutase
VELLMIRHAEPVKVVDRDGPADPELSGRGRRQAELLGAFLAPEGIEAIYSSPMRRAWETAGPLCSEIGAEPQVREALSEFDRLATTYIPLEEMRATRDERYLAMIDDDYSLYGVDMVQFRREVVEQVERIIADHPGGRVAIVCHGGVINAYFGHILGISRNSLFTPDYTSVSRLAASRSGVRSVLRLNEVAHLRGHGLLVSTV